MLGYAYKVNGVRFAGLLILIAGNKSVAEDLQHSLEGTTVGVRYDPKHPETSFVVEKQLLGRPVYQNPFWFD
jgi:hypothetical protein